MKKFLSTVRAKICRAALAVGAVLGLASTARAEGTAETAFDTTFVTSFLGKVSATVTAFWTNNKESLMVILGVIAIMAFVWLAVRLFKRSTSKA